MNVLIVISKEPAQKLLVILHTEALKKEVIFMGMSKKDLSRKHANIKLRISELEVKAKMDPLKRHPEIHEEIEKLKKQIAES